MSILLQLRASWAYKLCSLTHNQTRFLMSEFTRQAHPDAAHRERLSREIPGLTPRQVQVWFQNRYAPAKPQSHVGQSNPLSNDSILDGQSSSALPATIESEC